MVYFKNVKNSLRSEDKIVQIKIGKHEFKVSGSTPKNWLTHKNPSYPRVYKYATDYYFRIREDIERKLPGVLRQVENTPLMKTDSMMYELNGLIGREPDEEDNNQN